MRRWIPDLTHALRAEIAEVSEAGTTTSVTVTTPEPRRPSDLDKPGVSAVWFRVGAQDGFVPVGGVGKLRTGGLPLDAVVVATEPGRLLLSIEHPSGRLFMSPTSEFVIDPTQLLTLLKQRLSEAGNGQWNINWELLDRVAGFAAEAVRPRE